jgi:hypothetical protein
MGTSGVRSLTSVRAWAVDSRFERFSPAAKLRACPSAAAPLLSGEQPYAVRSGKVEKNPHVSPTARPPRGVSASSANAPE